MTEDCSVFIEDFLPAILKSGIGRTPDITIYNEINKKIQ